MLALPRMLGLSGQPDSQDGKSLEPMEKYGIQAMSIGFLIELLAINLVVFDDLGASIRTSLSNTTAPAGSFFLAGFAVRAPPRKVS